MKHRRMLDWRKASLTTIVWALGLIPLGGTAGVLWSDSFDSYAAGTSLSGPWAIAGNFSAVIDNSTSVSSPNSLRLYGVVGSCAGCLAWRTFGPNQSLEIDFYAKCGGETLSGCHPDFVTVQLWDGPAASSDGRTLLRFQSDGNIYGGDWGTGQNQGFVLQPYQPNVWYYCRIQYVVQGTNVFNNYWINNIFVGSTTYPIYSYESSLTNISFCSNEGTTWYDNISVSSVDTTNGAAPTIAIQNAVYLTSTNLVPGSIYQVQASRDMLNWTNQGSPFAATSSTWNSSNYWGVTNGSLLFFRLQAVP